MKLSIIIPVYNVKEYIKICVDSIINQNNVADYEIILVDDGSTDGSGVICDQIAENEKNVITIHQKNKGLSGARNTGIKKAKGKYLMFIDSDDFINHKESLGEFVKLLDEEYDIIQYKMLYYYEKNNKYIYLKDMDESSINIKEQLYNKVKTGTLSISACDKIIKRSIIVENNLYFKEGLLSEDIDWSLEVYLKANTLKSINKNIYVYRQQRKNSITNKIGEKHISSLYYIIRKWSTFEYKDKQIEKIYLNYIAYQYTILLTISNAHNTNKKMHKEIMNMKDILNNEDNYKVRMCNKVINLFGFNLGIKIMKLYLYLKNCGLIKI